MYILSFIEAMELVSRGLSVQGERFNKDVVVKEGSFGVYKTYNHKEGSDSLLHITHSVILQKYKVVEDNVT